MNKHILVIDDDPDILDALHILLSDAGYSVTAREKGEYAENLKKPDLPDIIILDVLLSGKDGREITRFLRQKTDTKHIPIILISAHPEVKTSFRVCGANDFLPKPFNVDELLLKIHNCLKNEKSISN